MTGSTKNFRVEFCVIKDSTFFPDRLKLEQNTILVLHNADSTEHVISITGARQSHPASWPLHPQGSLTPIIVMEGNAADHIICGTVGSFLVMSRNKENMTVSDRLLLFPFNPNVLSITCLSECGSRCPPSSLSLWLSSLSQWLSSLSSSRC